MKNTFQVTNAVAQTRTTFNTLDAGRVFFQKDTAFVKLPQPISCGLTCYVCGLSVWNAHNFSNAVHFCPDRLLDIEISEFVLDFPIFKS